jgi:hypothetical protein
MSRQQLPLLVTKCYDVFMGYLLFSLIRSAPLTRVRATSNMKVSAAAIAVVSAVYPDHPGAFLFLIHVLFWMLTVAHPACAQGALQTRTAMNNAIYQHALIQVTPMLFHHLELGMSYDGVLHTIGKAPLYCDSGETYCKAENGIISKSCLHREFIQANTVWMCHWDGRPASHNPASNLEVWFLGDHVTQVTARMPDGSFYKRDSGNTIHLERAVF